MQRRRSFIGFPQPPGTTESDDTAGWADFQRRALNIMRRRWRTFEVDGSGLAAQHAPGL